LAEYFWANASDLREIWTAPDRAREHSKSWGGDHAAAVVAMWSSGLSQDWGSGRDRHWRVWIVGWVESLSEAGTERAVIDGAPNLEQQVRAAS